jgi:hypothetical protein
MDHFAGLSAFVHIKINQQMMERLMLQTAIAFSVQPSMEPSLS